MTQQKTTAPALLWQERIHQWQLTGMPLTKWSRENNFKYSKCLYWKLRLLGSGTAEKSKYVPNGFVEIEEDKNAESGIFIEKGKMRIHLSKDFDQTTLLRCLSILEGGAC